MKNVFYLILLTTLAIACDDAEQDNLLNSGDDIVGDWSLTDLLLDPGDGSGVFMPAMQDISISIYADGSVTGNGMLCGMGQSVDGQMQTAQFVEEDSLIMSNCDSLPLSIGVQHMDTVLILSYPCIEPCLARLVKN